jgi:hypothetical protein
MFWDLVRKEDAIAERVAWAVSTKDEAHFLDMQGFIKFFRLFLRGGGDDM